MTFNTGIQLFLLFLACILAIGNVVKKARREEKDGGGITGWGKTIIVISVLAFVVGVVLLFRQTSANDADRKKADENTQRQLTETRRTLYAIDGIRGAFAVTYPLDTNGRSRYGTRMKTYANKWANGDRSVGQLPQVSGVAGDATGKHLASLTFLSTSPVAPDPMQEPEEALAFDQSSVSIGIYRQLGDKSRNPDLELRIAPGDNPFVWDEAYDTVQHSVTVWTGLVPLENSRNSSVRSVQDFVGARLHIEVPHGEVSAGKKGGPSYSLSYDVDKITNLMKRARINWVMLDITDWGTICMTKDDLKDQEPSGGAYEVRLPDSVDELSTKFRNTSKCQVEGWRVKR
jgi:hypothetical protein